MILRGEVKTVMDEYINYLHCIRKEAEVALKKGRDRKEIWDIPLERCGLERVPWYRKPPAPRGQYSEPLRPAQGGTGGVGRTPRSSMSALHDWLDRYFCALEQDNASPYTIKNYGTDIAQFLDACETQGITPLDGLTRDVARGYKMADLDEGGYVRAASPGASLSCGLSATSSSAITPGNRLFRRIHAPRLAERLPKYLTPEEVRKLIAVPEPCDAKGLRDRAILEVLYASGMRVSELAALNLGISIWTQVRPALSARATRSASCSSGPRCSSGTRLLRPGATNPIGQDALTRCLPEPPGGPPEQPFSGHARAHSGCRRRHPADSDATPAAPHLRYPYARWGRRSARRPGVARSRECCHHTDLCQRHATPRAGDLSWQRIRERERHQRERTLARIAPVELQPRH